MPLPSSRQRIELFVVELLDQFARAGVAAATLDDAAGDGAAGYVGMARDEPGPEQVSGTVHCVAHRSGGNDVGDPIGFDDHHVIGEQLELVVFVADQHPARGDGDRQVHFPRLPCSR